MNREILFRGKRMDNGEWVEAGTIISTNDADPICWIPVRGEKFLVEEDAHGNILSMEPKTALYRVDPATVGQYTGLTDKNGKRIFEGDVLGSRYDDLYPEDVSIEYVVWFRHAWHMIEDSYDPALIEEENLLPYSEVIGNIHDNPELLKGGEG